MWSLVLYDLYFPSYLFQSHKIFLSYWPPPTLKYLLCFSCHLIIIILWVLSSDRVYWGWNFWIIFHSYSFGFFIILHCIILERYCGNQKPVFKLSWCFPVIYATALVYVSITSFTVREVSILFCLIISCSVRDIFPLWSHS